MFPYKCCTGILIHVCMKINVRFRINMQCKNLDMSEKILSNDKKIKITITDRQPNRVNKLILVDVQSINYISLFIYFNYNNNN